MTQKLTMYRGDTETLLVRAASNGDPFDLAGAELRFTAKRKAEDDDTDAVIVKASGGEGIDVTDEQAGEAVITIDPEDTFFLAHDTTLVWDVQLTRDGRIRTVAAGELKVTRDISRTAP